MRALETIWALCYRELLRFVRERSALYATLARPTLWLLVLGSGMQNAFRERTGVPYAAYLLPGVVTMTILFAGLFSGVSTVWDREFGFLKEVLVAPVSRLEIVLGKLLAGTLVTTAQALITLLFAPLVGVTLRLDQLLSTLLVVLLASAGVVALALNIAARMRSFEGFSNFANLLALPLFFTSGSMYPVADAPAWLWPLVHGNPMTYAVDALRTVALGSGNFSFGRDLLVVSAFTVVMTALAALSFKRAY
ncbi:MAG: daunorubicin resistance transporter, inner rane subunit [Myxococcaceae bacterium]|nr:daunorubicin resistance transporter, inner rane subunit [Myxococcaceae bacterium]